MRYLLPLLFFCLEIFSCTGIKLSAKDGSVVHGRTAEFGIELDLSLLYIPRNFEFTSQTPDGPGLRYTAKYASVGIIAFGIPSLMDGLNEKGLAVGIFYFPGFAGYAKGAPAAKSLSPIDFSNWLLTQFASIDEIKAKLSDIFIAPTIFPKWGPAAPPFHYIVYDRSGRSIVIEPIEGKLVVYDNPIGTITNSPTFDWHMTNLSNYATLSPYNAKPVKIGGLELVPFGQGSGFFGLPGDFSPPSRFIRAAFFSSAAIPSANSPKAIQQGFHILNNFDIPVGTVREMKGSVTYTDRTLATCMRDPQTLRYYYKTYEDQNIQMIDLSTFDFEAKGLKNLSL